VVSAIVVPRFHDKNKPEFKENPPTLKEVRMVPCILCHPKL